MNKNHSVNKNRSMNKIIKIASLIILTALLMSLTLPVTAQADNDQRDPPRFTDNADLLTDLQASALTKKLDEISIRQKFDVVILTINSLRGNDARIYAADYYEQNGFGYNESLDGIILMLAMDDRDFAFVTTGYGERVFSDARQEYLENKFLPHLRNDEYVKAFTTFADTVEGILNDAAAAAAAVEADSNNNGESNNNDNNYSTGDSTYSSGYYIDDDQMYAHFWTAILSLIIAFIIPGIVVAVWTSKLKSVKKQDYACAYIKQGSMVVNLHHDRFLYRNVRRTQRVDNSSSGGGGRGSFSSSSGRSFSGRSGKF